MLFGNVNQFSFGEAAFMDVDAISGNNVIVVYRDWDNLSFGTAKIGTFSNDKITFGDSVVFSASNTFLPKIKTVNDSVFLVVYRDMGQSGKGVIVKGTMVNNSIVFGPSLPFSCAMISSTSLIMMESISFIIAYKDNGNNGFGTIRSGNLEEGNILLGQEYVFNEATSYENVLLRLSDTTFLVSYRDAGNGEAGTIKAGEIINGIVVFSEAAVFSPSPAWDISQANIGPARFMVSCSTDNQTGESVLGNYENGGLYFSDPFVFSDTVITATSTTIINDSIAVVSFSDGLNNGAGTTILAKINSGGIIFGDPVVFKPEGSFTLSETVLSDSTFLLVFRDGGNEFSGSAIIGKVQFDPITGIVYFPGNIDGLVFPNPANDHFYVEGRDISKVELMNLNGRKILSSKITAEKTRFGLSGLEKGIYMVKISSKGKTEIRKLVVE
ncbi:MAG: T9SS type A sorting domain-containing protein [Chlorobi bacterium]|nr:T9SS type A sorting domain-containing protein [Chlorobiota bacterium]